MKHMELGAEAEPVFEIILDSVNNSQSLIKKMQSTRGLLEAPVSARSLSEVLNECLRSLRATYDDVEVEMDLRVREPVVRADDYIEFLFMNILENAVVHNDKRIRHVWVRVNEVERGYEVLISDNGPGLTEPKKEFLFDPERRFGGVGVHQAMSIVRKYHGRISVHDRITGDPDQGAEFRIWLPQ
jgi:signal transduction histidine kinase